MPNEDNKVLKYSYREKSLKAPFFISFDIIKIINFKEKEMMPLTEEETYEEQRVCYMCKK